jgi:hypothetical protein
VQQNSPLRIPSHLLTPGENPMFILRSLWDMGRNATCNRRFEHVIRSWDLVLRFSVEERFGTLNAMCNRSLNQDALPVSESCCDLSSVEETFGR